MRPQLQSEHCFPSSPNNAVSAGVERTAAKWGTMFDETGFDESEVRGQTELGTASRQSYPRMQTNTTSVLICPNLAHRRLLTQSLEAQNSTISLNLEAYPSYND